MKLEKCWLLKNRVLRPEDDRPFRGPICGVLMSTKRWRDRIDEQSRASGWRPGDAVSVLVKSSLCESSLHCDVSLDWEGHSTTSTKAGILTTTKGEIYQRLA